MRQTTAPQHDPQPFDIPFVSKDVLPEKRLRHHI